MKMNPLTPLLLLLLTAAPTCCGAADEAVIGSASPHVLVHAREDFLSSLDTTQDFLQNETESTLNESTSKPNGPKVAVIGCGPGGMFFLHALATKRQKLIEKGNVEALNAFPQVTVFEKTNAAGGVWRPHSDTSGSVDMMGGLWSNSPSFELEFFDYTYHDHFGSNASIPLYLSRKILLEYMLKRVTRVDPDIFKNVQFNTQVVNVKFKENLRKFMVRVKDLSTNTKTQYDDFDYVVWAGGVQSSKFTPPTIESMLQDQRFQGESLHSSDISDLDSSIAGKRLVLIGDSFSAEDLALQAIKMGVQQVYITSAQQNGEASMTSSWPLDKVTNLKCIPTAVIHNGAGLKCSQVEWDNEVDGYAEVDGGYSYELANIDAVVYCTGYKTRQTYLESSLRYKCKTSEFSVDEDWRSNPNVFSASLGHVVPDDELESEYVCDNIYRHALMDNPNMMFIRPVTDCYLPEIDAIAWSLAARVAGEYAIPSRKEREMHNRLEQMQELHVAKLRRKMDDEYRDAIRAVKPNFTRRSKENRAVGFDEYFKEFAEYELKLIARDQVLGGHGGGWGSYDKLSDRGELLAQQFVESEFCRDFDLVEENEKEWRTFRDIDPTLYKSVYTGRHYSNLKAHWMDLDDDGEPLVVATEA